MLNLQIPQSCFRLLASLVLAAFMFFGVAIGNTANADKCRGDGNDCVPNIRVTAPKPAPTLSPHTQRKLQQQSGGQKSGGGSRSQDSSDSEEEEGEEDASDDGSGEEDELIEEVVVTEFPQSTELEDFHRDICSGVGRNPHICAALKYAHRQSQQEITEQDVINACRATIVGLGTAASYYGPGAILKALQAGGKVASVVVKRFDMVQKYFELEVHVSFKIGTSVLYNVYSEFKSLPESGCTWAIEQLS